MKLQPRSDPSIWRRWRIITGRSRSGLKTARRISRTALHLSAQRSRGSKAASSMPSTSTNRLSVRPAQNGFIHNEALAYELAARFYAARGFKQIADLYLRNARYGYLRWGAVGKVRQLDETYPAPQTGRALLPGPTSTIGAPVEHLDLATVIKVSQAVSGEIVLENLIDTLMRTAMEQAGAERGLLILPRGQRASYRGGSHDQRRYGDRTSGRRGRDRSACCPSRCCTTSCAPGRV